MRLSNTVLALLFAATLAACGKPLPADKAAFAGQWSGPAMQMLITQDGRVEYSRVNDGNTTSVKAPIKEFAGNNLIVGLGPMATTFVVSAPPHQDGEAWKMTVDGVELTKK
ncbi:hypothetical protein [Massilia sp. TSP1-1-2]|uniref:hypothetical protein n=1 Tax=unclassified Massilia TaxID=2609279 RepID=UPI003CF12E7B